MSQTPNNLRIREGLARLAVILRRDEWERAKKAELNPTQLSILDLIGGRPGGMGVQAIARHLALSQPTVTDSVMALERKGLVEKLPVADRRAVTIVLSGAGRAALAAADEAGNSMSGAIDSLESSQQEALLLALMGMIRHLQETDAIPVQRMCISCRHFEPLRHANADRPHHCHFVNAAFGPPDIRIDCREHETAEPASRAANWDAFQKG